MEIKTLIFSILFLGYLSVSAQDKDVILDKSSIVESENLNSNNRTALSIMKMSVRELNSEDISPEVKIISIKKLSNTVTKYNTNSRLSYTLTPRIIENSAANDKEAIKNNEEKSEVKRVSATVLKVERIEN